MTRAQPAPDKPVLAAAMSASLDRLVTSHFGGALTLWDTQTLTPLSTWSHPDGLSSLAVHPSGQPVAVAGPTPAPVALYDAKGKPSATLKGPEGRVDALTFSPDGQLLAVAGAPRAPSGDSDKDARRYGPATVQLHATPIRSNAAPQATIPLGQVQVTGLAVGAFVVVLTRDGQLTLFERARPHAIHASFDVGHRGQALAMTADGQRLAAVVDGQVVILGDGVPRVLPSPAPAQAEHIAWSPDARHVVVTGYEEAMVVSVKDGATTWRLPCADDTAHPTAAWVGAERGWVVGGRRVLVRAVAVSSGEEVGRVSLRHGAD